MRFFFLNRISVYIIIFVYMHLYDNCTSLLNAKKCPCLPEFNPYDDILFRVNFHSEDLEFQ